MSSIREKLAHKKSKLAQPREEQEGHPADLHDFQDGGFYQVEVESILPNPDQPRKYFDPDRLSDLSESVRQKGVLQPILIRRDEAGQIYLVAGERRLRAAKMAGIEKIPTILTKGNPAEIALIENLQRENLPSVDEAEALAKMIHEYGYTQEQLASIVGKARSTITETLSLNRLPEEVRDECRRADNFPRRLLVEIAKQDSPGKMTALFHKVKEYGLKSDQVRTLTRKRERLERPPVAITLSKIDALVKNLGRIEWDRLSVDEKVELSRALQALAQEIQEIIG